MKPSQSLLLLFTAMSAGALTLSSCSKTDDTTQTIQNTKADAKKIAADVKATVSESWDNIKDYTFEKRSDFVAALNRMADNIDGKIREMNAKLKGLPDDGAKDRDRAMKELNDARADLKSRLADLDNATADTWADAKEKVAQAWKRVQTAYDNVKATSGS